ncbi:MAG: hypothetical protein K0S29_121 [Gammaproteobacteria bacterium]|jgi:hypothetical protein|nr:hypothetical protein [Gammaproteobacteria bacterium]
MSRIPEIKALYERGDYQQAREMCLEGIYECQEFAFLHSGTELENSREAELNEYKLLKDRVSFAEVRDYFHRKTHKNWNPDMVQRLVHFIMLVKMIFSSDQQALHAHKNQAPGLKFFSEYKHLIQCLDEQDIRKKSSEIIHWLKKLPIANTLALELEEALKKSLNQAQVPITDSRQGNEQLQLPLFRK